MVDFPAPQVRFKKRRSVDKHRAVLDRAPHRGVGRREKDRAARFVKRLEPRADMPAQKRIRFEIYRALSTFERLRRARKSRVGA